MLNSVHPIRYVLHFANGKETTLVRCKYEDLVEGGIATIFIREDMDKSLGTVELLNGDLVVNDPKCDHLELIQDILSDLI